MKLAKCIFSYLFLWIMEVLGFMHDVKGNLLGFFLICDFTKIYVSSFPPHFSPFVCSHIPDYISFSLYSSSHFLKIFESNLQSETYTTHFSISYEKTQNLICELPPKKNGNVRQCSFIWKLKCMFDYLIRYKREQ